MGNVKCYIFLLNTHGHHWATTLTDLLEILNLPPLLHVANIDDFQQNNTELNFFPWDDFPQDGETPVTFLVSAEAHLAEQMHALFRFHQRYGFDVLRSISVLDAPFFENIHSNLCDAMAHFADLLLIDESEVFLKNVVQALMDQCKKKKCYPLTIQRLSKHKIGDLSGLFDPQPRRMALIFDDLDPIDFIDEEQVDRAPFTIPSLDQRDPYLQQNEQGHYVNRIESLERV
ncbi:MAG: hypothetical protein LW808_001505 [Verrucomicrobiota bacterium]|nr:MAG: hypothetical protein LW808_001505 [Verrucomicrobiota bacterium]